MAGRSLGRRFGLLWAAYTVSTFGTGLAFDAFSLVAILALHASATEVSALASAGLAAGAVLALPLGPWLARRHTRLVMVAMDLVRFAALLTIPLAFALRWLTFAQLLIVSVLVACADIAFRAASGAYLKALVPPADLLTANGRFESTTWTATALGRTEPSPPRGTATPRLRAGELLDGWRCLLTHSVLRSLLINSALNNGLITASAPLLAVLMLGRLGFAPWQYGLAFAVPCLGALVGSRLAGPLVARFGQHRTMLVAGTLRAWWSIGLAFVQPGVGGLVLVMIVECGLISCSSVFNPILSTYRLTEIPTRRVPPRSRPGR